MPSLTWKLTQLPLLPNCRTKQAISIRPISPVFSRAYNGKAEDAIAGANYTVTESFTLLDKTNAITFPAKIEVTSSSLNAEAIFTIDHTKWAMKYAADPALGEHPILPEVAIHLKLSGHKF